MQIFAVQLFSFIQREHSSSGSLERAIRACRLPMTCSGAEV